MAEEFVQRNHTMWTKIRLIGVWDTVAALGLPTKWLSALIDKISIFSHSYHNFEMADSVECGRHALSTKRGLHLNLCSGTSGDRAELSRDRATVTCWSIAQLSRRFDEVSGSGSHYGSSGAQQKPLLKKPDIRLLTYLPFKLATPQNYRRLNMF
jgi:hypothetical protein